MAYSKPLRRLTAKHEAFCRAVVEGDTYSGAYRRAFDCARTKPRTVWKRAGELAHDPLIEARLAVLKKAAAERAEIKLADWLRELDAIGRSRVTHVMDWGPDGVTVKPASELSEPDRAAIAEVSQSTTRTGGTIRVKLHDKLGALDRIGRHMGWLKERAEARGSSDAPIDAQDVSDLELALLATAARKADERG
jgi:phage terminase small subunit